MDDGEAERQALRDELGALELERDRLASTPTTLAEHAAYNDRFAAFNERLAACLRKCPEPPSR